MGDLSIASGQCRLALLVRGDEPAKLMRTKKAAERSKGGRGCCELERWPAGVKKEFFTHRCYIDKGGLFERSEF